MCRGASPGSEGLVVAHVEAVDDLMEGRDEVGRILRVGLLALALRKDLLLRVGLADEADEAGGRPVGAACWAAGVDCDVVGDAIGAIDVIVGAEVPGARDDDGYSVGVAEADAAFGVGHDPGGAGALRRACLSRVATDQMGVSSLFAESCS